VLDLSVVVTIGKYALLVGLYAFVLVVFRGIMSQLAAESARTGSRGETAAGRRRRERPRTAEVPAPRPQAPEPSRPAAEAEPAPSLAADERAPAPEVAAERPAPCLRVLESGDDSHHVAEELPLSAAVTIGRSEENSLQLDDRFVSSRHALICLRDGRRILMDRGSTNGTFVNGERVEEEVELRDGDRIALGNTVFQYRAG